MTSARLSSFNRFEFKLSQGSRVDESLKNCRIGDWHLSCSSTLSITNLNVAGFEEALLLTVVPPSGIDCQQPLEVSKIAELVFVLFLSLKGSLHIRKDGCGAMPVVYSKEAHVVSSSPSVISDLRYDETLSKLLTQTNAFFPFGLTAKPGVKRLLPNHTLSIPEFKVARHWSNREISQDLDLADVGGPIVDEIKKILASLCNSAPLLLSLTAGRDSRIIAGCAQGLPQVEAFTSNFDLDSDWDSKTAKLVAEYLNIPHVTNELVEVTEAERQEFFEWTGYSFAGRTSYAFLTGPARKDAWVVSGHCGEIGRNYYPAFTDKSVAPEEVIKALKLPAHQQFLSAAEEWIEGLDGLNGRQLADLLYIEARLGCWAGPQLARPSQYRGRIAPFGHKRIVDLMLRAKRDHRSKNSLPQQVIKEIDHRLLSFRFSPRGRKEAIRVGLARLGFSSLSNRVP